jgi:hypothetical protein
VLPSLWHALRSVGSVVHHPWGTSHLLYVPHHAHRAAYLRMHRKPWSAMLLVVPMRVLGT